MKIYQFFLWYEGKHKGKEYNKKHWDKSRASVQESIGGFSVVHDGNGPDSFLFLVESFTSGFICI